MRNLAGLVLGALCAGVIACGGASKSSRAPTSADTMGAAPGMVPQANDRDEIDALDQRITAEMAQLALPRPPPPANACVEGGCREPMSTAATAAQEPKAPTCKPAVTETCKDSCRLSDSICGAAARICTIASQLGGDDAYANEKCNTGSASCAASRERCCGCM